MTASRILARKNGRRLRRGWREPASPEAVDRMLADADEAGVGAVGAAEPADQDGAGAGAGRRAR